MKYMNTMFASTSGMYHDAHAHFQATVNTGQRDQGLVENFTIFSAFSTHLSRILDIPSEFLCDSPYLPYLLFEYFRPSGMVWSVTQEYAWLALLEAQFASFSIGGLSISKNR
jgi:hypothetical protein